MSFSVKMRQHIERLISAKAVDALLAAGYEVEVFDGEEITVKRCKDRAKILAALMTTDDDHLMVYKDGWERGWIRLVYGNDGWDVISDYTTNLEGVLAPVNKYAEEEWS